MVAAIPVRASTFSYPLSQAKKRQTSLDRFSGVIHPCVHYDGTVNTEHGDLCCFEFLRVALLPAATFENKPNQ